MDKDTRETKTKSEFTHVPSRYITTTHGQTKRCGSNVTAHVQPTNE